MIPTSTFTGPRLKALVLEEYRFSSGRVAIEEGSTVWFRKTGNPGLYFVVDNLDYVLFTTDSADWVWRHLIIEKKWY